MRCLPAARTRSMVRPAIVSWSSTLASGASAVSNLVTFSPASASCSVRAARKMVSPSGICGSQLIAEGARSETGLGKERGDCAPRRRLVIDLGGEDGAPRATRYKRCQSPGDLASGHASRRLILRKKDGELLLAASHVADQPPIHENHARPDAATECSARAFGPFDDRAVWIRGIGRGEHDRLGIVGVLTERSQAVQRPGTCELRGAEGGDEIATPDFSTLFHRLEDRVDGTETATDPLGAGRLTGDDAIAIEELL